MLLQKEKKKDEFELSRPYVEYGHIISDTQVKTMLIAFSHEFSIHCK